MSHAADQALEEKKYTECQQLLHTQSIAAARDFLSGWLLENPASPHGQYLLALLDRYDVKPIAQWREPFRAGFTCGKRLPAPAPKLPYWEGTEQSDSGLLLFGDQGIGDQIRWSGHLPTLHGRFGKKLTVFITLKIIPILKRNFPRISFEPLKAEAQFDPGRLSASAYQCAMGDLDGLLWPNENYVQSSGFLTAEPTKKQTIQNRMKSTAAPKGLKIGICFRSMLRSNIRDHHYTTLEEWLPVLTLPQHQFFSLQYDRADEEITAFENKHSIPIMRWPEDNLLDDIETLAALIANLDLVISVPTSVADLSMALGVPVWRIQTGGKALSEQTSFNPWYGTHTKVYYRSVSDGWSGLMKTLSDKLKTTTADNATSALHKAILDT